MTLDFFNQQIDRLKTQWGNSYGVERQKILWAAFRNYNDGLFQAAVTHALSAYRTAPLVKEMGDAIEHARNEEAQLRVSYGLKYPSTAELLNEAAAKNSTADPEFVKMCLKHLQNYQTKKISSEEFISGCNDIDRLARQLVLGKKAEAAPKGQCPPSPRPVEKVPCKD